MKNCKDLQTNTSCFQITKSNLFLWKWDVICVEHNMCYICKNKFAVKILHLFSEGRVFSYVEYTLLEGGIKHDKPNPNLS
jgi:hypothetical protein